MMKVLSVCYALLCVAFMLSLTAVRHYKQIADHRLTQLIVAQEQLRSQSPPRARNEAPGWLDGVGPTGIVYGWSCDPEVTIFTANKEEVNLTKSTVTANLYREDLKDAGVCSGTGNHAFEYQIPPGTRPFRVFAAANGQHLHADAGYSVLVDLWKPVE